MSMNGRISVISEAGNEIMKHVEFKLKDIVGMANLKATMKSFVSTEVVKMCRQAALGLERQIKRPTYLFLGPPGTGKTKLGEIVAGIWLISVVKHNTVKEGIYDHMQRHNNTRN